MNNGKSDCVCDILERIRMWLTCTTTIDLAHDSPSVPRIEQRASYQSRCGKVRTFHTTETIHLQFFTIRTAILESCLAEVAI
jgi:hypothetical protein